MSMVTVDRTPPPFFRQGPSPLAKLLVLGALSVLLMVVDARLQWATPVRSALSAVLSPLQWLAMQPARAVQWGGQYVGDVHAARQEAAEARAELTRQARRAALVEHLAQENRELRTLLGMRERLPPEARSAEVLFETADLYSRKVVIDQGQLQGIEAGAPVIDGYGVLGQVTRVYPSVSEVTLLIDPQQVIPVINTRTGQRNLAYGAPLQGGGHLELKFVLANTDTEPGDILTTSGVDGVYPPGLPVAKVLQVDRHGPGGFARIECEPMARMNNTLHVLVVTPQARTDSELQGAARP